MIDETNVDTLKEAGVEIRIARLNNDKTRKVDGSDVLYDVYFELSGIPPDAWGSLFEGEWKFLNAAHQKLWQSVQIDRGFLIIRCPLQEVLSMHLPFLKKAVTVTNKKYKQFVEELAIERKGRKDAWELERSKVDVVANSLQF